MIKVTLWILFIAVAVYLIICVFMYTQQRKMLFYPTAPVEIPSVEAVWLENQGQNLKIWQVAGTSDKALIYFGGNAENVALNIEQFRKVFPQYHIFLCNYRGYGGSSGSPAEDALYADATAVYDYVSKKFSSISVMGRSLGSGVAVYLAANRNIDRIILVTPYDSMANLARNYYPLLPVSLLLQDRFEASVFASELTNPVLVMIAEKDEVIPRKISESLVDALGRAQVTKRVYGGAGHNNIGLFPQYEEDLRAFMR